MMIKHLQIRDEEAHEFTDYYLHLVGSAKYGDGLPKDIDYALLIQDEKEYCRFLKHFNFYPTLHDETYDISYFASYRHKNINFVVFRSSVFFERYLDADQECLKSALAPRLTKEQRINIYKRHLNK